MTGNINMIAKTKEEFVVFIKPYDDWATQHWDYQRGIIAGQVAEETGWGKKVIDKNLFNIKKGSSWTGKVVLITTTEYINGVSTIVKSYFRVYNTYNHSMNDYIDLIRGWFYYAQAWTNRNNAYVYYTALTGKFATNPYYYKNCFEARAIYLSMIGE